jgi:hypothetical protein
MTVRIRSDEVREAANRIAALTGHRVVHASKGTGSMRFYLTVILEGEWDEDFVRSSRPVWEPSDAPAARWLVECGLPQPYMVSWAYGAPGRRLVAQFYWADLYEMGWKVPDFRSPSEIARGVSLAELR